MSFSSDLKRATRNVWQSANEVFRARVLDVDRRIVFRTPVKTGRLRGNWQASVNDPILTAIDAPRAPSNVIAEAVREANRAEIGDTVYFVNNLPYALEIERGSSRQAPQGMLRIAVIEASDR